MKAQAPGVARPPSIRHEGWGCTAAATILIALVVGSRSSFGLFLSPINTTTGVGLAVLGFAAALGQLAQGVAQPVVGMLADRHGAPRVVMAGSLVFAIATASITCAPNALVLTVLVVLTGIAGTAMGSIAMLLGEVGRRVAPERQGLALGIVGAGGPAGQLLFGPLTQGTIQATGWIHAMWLSATLSVLALPLALVFRRSRAMAPCSDCGVQSHAAEAASPEGAGSNSGAVRAALRDPVFWQIGGGFAVCGFHMSFLTMHMPGVIERCGFAATLAGVWLAVLGVTNIAGSLVIGLLLRRHAATSLLIVLHCLRAIFIACLLAVPATPAAMLAFAAAMGATYTAALPPTTVLVTARFGPRRVSTLFGVVMLLHQTGSFAGAWLGSLAAETVGGYTTLWLLDIGLALLAAAVYLCNVRGSERGRSGSLYVARTA